MLQRLLPFALTVAAVAAGPALQATSSSAPEPAPSAPPATVTAPE